MDESIYVSSVIDKLPPSWKDFKHSLKHGKEDLSMVQLGSHLYIEESLMAQESDKGKVKEVVGPSMNIMEEGGNNKNNKQNKGKKCGFKDNNSGSGSNKKPKLECWKCGKTGHFKKDYRSGNKKNNASASGSGKGSKDQSQDQGQNLVYVWNRFIKYSISLIYEAFYVQVDAITWWIDSGATTHVCKDRCWFKTYEPVEDVYVLYIGDDHFSPDHGKGSVVLEFSFGKSITLFNVLYVPKLRKNLISGPVLNKCGYKQVYESDKDAIFDENRFSSIPRPKDIIPNSDESQKDDHSNDVPSETPKPRKSKRARKAKSYGSDFQLYLVEGSRDQIGSQYSYCYSIEDDPITYNEAMQSRDVAFWNEAIDDEIGSIMENNTWVLSNLPPGCKPLVRKWIFKRKLKVDGIIDKFKAQLVIQGFRKKEGIDYFDTYAPVSRITTIRLLFDLVAIHNLVIHQMDVKITFLDDDLEEVVYMKQPQGFVMPGNEHKVCKLVKSLYALKQEPKQWHQKFNEVVLSSSFPLNQSDKCVFSKFDGSGKGVIICLYVDDMLIFGTDQNQVDKTKKFVSSKFSMKDMGEADCGN
ncbi:zinc finger, CCHC-type containing protein [Tanacetum coccineum]